MVPLSRRHVDSVQTIEWVHEIHATHVYCRRSQLLGKSLSHMLLSLNSTESLYSQAQSRQMLRAKCHTVELTRSQFHRQRPFFIDGSSCNLLHLRFGLDGALACGMRLARTVPTQCMPLQVRAGKVIVEEQVSGSTSNWQLWLSRYSLLRNLNTFISWSPANTLVHRWHCAHQLVL